MPHTKGSVVVVKKFIDSGNSAKVTMTEMQEFWKSISEEEKLRFTLEAVALQPELAVIGLV